MFPLLPLKKMVCPNRMEAASNGVRVLFSVLSEELDIAECLVKFSRQMEDDYADTQDIHLFIFSIHCFFCLDAAQQLKKLPEKVKEIRTVWLHENDEKYTHWLSSPDDSHEPLQWAKWTFQAKNSIFDEFLSKGRE